jgi:hypothetical protein
MFPRSDLIDVTCEAEALITCELPGRKGGGDAAATEDDGVFVCLQIFNPLTGVSESEAFCISPDRAWVTDECGCCDGEYPELPVSAEIECEDAEQACDLRNDEG